MSKQYPGGLITKSPVTPSGPYENSTASGIWTLDQQAYWRKLNQWPIAGSVEPDPQFNYVTMLLHGDGTNGAQNNTFLDSSASPLTITRNGNTTQGSFSPYGSNWSNSFIRSASSYITISDSSAFSLGTSDFTIECWIFPTLSGSTLDISGQADSSITTTSRSFLFQINGTGNIIAGVWSGGTGYTITSSSAVSFNTWNHIAFVRSSGTLTLYINGVSVGTSSISTASVNDSSNNLSIGRFGERNAAYYDGYVSNFRMVVGTAIYTGSFTPSTTPLTAISGTALLTCADNRFIDDSTNNFAITANGTSSVQRFNPFGTSTAYSTSVIGGSGYFDGSGDTLTCTGTLPATADFTLSLWVYPTSLAGYAVAIQQAGSGNTFYLYLGYADGKTDIQVGSTNYNDYTAGVYKANQWNYVQVVKASSAYSFYVNGTALSVTSSTGNIGTTSIASGTLTVNYNTGCYITDVRIVNTALGNSVPTAPLTAVSGTTMLLSMQNGAIFDNAMITGLETVGGAQISTSVKKFGTGSMYFDGTGDYLVGNGGQGLGGNFTIEAWVYAIAFTGDARTIVDTRDAWFSATGVNLYFNDAGNLIMYVNGGDRITSATAYSTATWYFVTLARSGSTITMYVNGTSVGTYTYSTALTDKSITIGTTVDNRSAGTSWHFNGYIDDLRITAGYARYTANFTPPTAAFPDIGPT